MSASNSRPRVEVFGLLVDIELIGIFVALTPVGVYLGLHLSSWTAWKGAITVWMGYFTLLLRHPPRTAE